jgi:hypothetical protein
MKHAMVPTGEFMVPLIGIPETAVEERCDRCGNHLHLSKIVISEDGRFICVGCLVRLAIARSLPSCDTAG